MSVFIPSTSRRISTLEAYRALLRAVTYLPDPAARIYWHDRIVSSFKSVSPSKSPNQIEPPAYRLLSIPVEVNGPDPRAKQRLSTAWKTVRLLEGAANGIEINLKKVLLETYGRTGKRRRELISDFLQPAESSLPADEQALKALIQDPSRSPAKNFVPSERFRAFIISQQRETSRKFTHLSPPIHGENTWGRPLPLRLQKSRAAKWWASTLAKVLPPLPEREWNRLRDLATGVIPAEGLLLRRKRPLPASPSQAEVSKKILELVRTPLEISIIDDIVFDPEKGLTIVPQTPGEDDLQSTRHERDQRALRRLYAEIWELSPKMSQDEATKKWIIEWGNHKSRFMSGEVTSPSLKDLELFEGIELLPEQKSKKIKVSVKKKDRVNMRVLQAEAVRDRERLNLSP